MLAPVEKEPVMNRNDAMSRDERVDRPLLQHFRGHILLLALAALVFVAIAVYAAAPWSDESSTTSGPEALPTPAQQSTPNP
jgi:hypothetical protein